jgi:Na+/H+ antiporter NhaD/arsenite permease-like protein
MMKNINATTRFAAIALALLLWPATAMAAPDAVLDVPEWTIAPFVLLLATIAVLPLVAGRWWHSNLHRAFVAGGFALPVVIYLVFLQWTTHQNAVGPLLHELENYAFFIVLLGSLYIVAGGAMVTGDRRATPGLNTALLAAGAVLANLIGTTGASMLLIRPILRFNRHRQHSSHLPVFFIFVVSNLGGLLTPLGDPPLFLGFLHGVPFFWTLLLWPQWLLANGLVLSVFFAWDFLANRREPSALETGTQTPLGLSGGINLGLLCGIMAGVLLQGMLPEPWGESIGGVLMLVMAGLSLGLTPRALRKANGFTWGPILEVAILFAGIFVTMVPALAILGNRGQDLGVSQPWQFFWLTGCLSGFLDNAPTYLTFATLAAGSSDFAPLASSPGADQAILQAISCGAVFMGALTYIGNGPNFMVQAIAEDAGYATPSFFGYMAYSIGILGPVFVIVTLVFFRPV